MEFRSCARIFDSKIPFFNFTALTSGYVHLDLGYIWELHNVQNPNMFINNYVQRIKDQYQTDERESPQEA